MITISKQEYDDLRERDEWLTALEQAGVDNWAGVYYAHELANKGEIYVTECE